MEFFKRRQRELGVTTDDLGRAIGRDRTVISKIYGGSRPIKPHEVPLIAELLEVSVDEVIDHAGLNTPGVVRAISQPGFAEQEATPFDWQGAEAAHKGTLAAAFGFNRPGAEVWAVRGRSMDLAGYLDGDAIVVDRTRAERAKAGDDVLAQVYDFATGSARTVFRRYDPPFIYAVSTELAELKPYLVDGERVVIVGVITFTWRMKDKL